jgi:hypothetical protein
MEFNIETGDGYTLNYEAISKSKDMMAITRLLASDLIRDGYINVGEFITGLSDSDVQMLINKIEEQDNGEHDYKDLILMSEMLAEGEGCEPAQDDDVFITRMEQFVMLLTIESLHRKGLVKAFSENYSFHEDMMDKVIVEKLDD